MNDEELESEIEVKIMEFNEIYCMQFRRLSKDSMKFYEAF